MLELAFARTPIFLREKRMTIRKLWLSSNYIITLKGFHVQVNTLQWRVNKKGKVQALAKTPLTKKTNNVVYNAIHLTPLPTKYDTVALKPRHRPEKSSMGLSSPASAY